MENKTAEFVLNIVQMTFFNTHITYSSFSGNQMQNRMQNKAKMQSESQIHLNLCEFDCIDKP